MGAGCQAAMRSSRRPRMARGLARLKGVEAWPPEPRAVKVTT